MTSSPPKTFTTAKWGIHPEDGNWFGMFNWLHRTPWPISILGSGQALIYLVPDPDSAANSQTCPRSFHLTWPGFARSNIFSTSCPIPWPALSISTQKLLGGFLSKENNIEWNTRMKRRKETCKQGQADELHHIVQLHPFHCAHPAMITKQGSLLLWKSILLSSW
jgi:hypothetical protein